MVDTSSGRSDDGNNHPQGRRQVYCDCPSWRPGMAHAAAHDGSGAWPLAPPEGVSSGRYLRCLRRGQPEGRFSAPSQMSPHDLRDFYREGIRRHTSQRGRRPAARLARDRLEDVACCRGRKVGDAALERIQRIQGHQRGSGFGMTMLRQPIGCLWANQSTNVVACWRKPNPMKGGLRPRFCARPWRLLVRYSDRQLVRMGTIWQWAPNQSVATKEISVGR